MDVLPPPDYPPINPSEHPQIPTRTPHATLEILQALCIRGDVQTFREILDSPLSSSERIDICDFYGTMIQVIKRNDAQFIRELLNRGLPMDPRYALEAIKVQGKDALEAFLEYSYAVTDEEMTAWLLDPGADLTSLSLAVESAPITVIHLMLSRGGNVQRGQLLHHAIERRSDTIEVLGLLIEKGALINSAMYEDYPSWALFHFMGLGTPLHKAAELGKMDVIRYLTSKGASQSIKDANSRTAIECAHMSN
ncbi:ankyrin repeat-containing domain protein [Aspergillus minisclerotigenes]|uniref:Ankyrin repeat-containing domain protein n=1 Tax=Aspergillus minisclerotigenes TaxID=656917 RepID=A0A5N6JBJ2_9EURO|nr:ankyrin repeat-containing domain protein [Aspergillus minisclerotigenes]